MSNFLDVANNRKLYFEIWERSQTRLPARNAEEALIAHVMAEHPKYFEVWDDPETFAEYEFDTETEENPFLHVAMHVIVESQLREGKPDFVKDYADRRALDGADRHDIRHELALALVEELFHSLQTRRPFNEAAYRAALETLARKNGK